MSFQSIPILNLSDADDPAKRDKFLLELRQALVEVGFLYIQNTFIQQPLLDDVIRQAKAFFELPDPDKLAIEMKNSPHFLGYSWLGNEITKHKVDWREQVDLGSDADPPGPEEPRYRNLIGPSQWPDMPKFRETFHEYIDRMGEMSLKFTRLVAEAIGLKPDAFSAYVDEKTFHKLKIVKYPEREGSGQGVGPHKDSMLSSYLLQATPQKGLQVQNASGDWIDCTPIPNTFVVAIGQGLEAMTKQVCVSTTHRVLSPQPGDGARISIPFFSGVSLDAAFKTMDIPAEVLKLRREQHTDVEMTFDKTMWENIGEATLYNRVKSHQDVGARFYPDLLEEVKRREPQAVQ